MFCIVVCDILPFARKLILLCLHERFNCLRNSGMNSSVAKLFVFILCSEALNVYCKLLLQCDLSTVLFRGIEIVSTIQTYCACGLTAKATFTMAARYYFYVCGRPCDFARRFRLNCNSNRVCAQKEKRGLSRLLEKWRRSYDLFASFLGRVLLVIEAKRICEGFWKAIAEIRFVLYEHLYFFKIS